MKLLCPKCMVRHGTDYSLLCSVCEAEQLLETFKKVEGRPTEQRWFVGFHGAKDCYHVVAGPFVEKSVANAMAKIIPIASRIMNLHTVISESEAMKLDPESTKSLIEQSK